MKHVFILAASLLTANPVDRAVNAFIKAPSTVQSAFYINQCTDEELDTVSSQYDTLSAEEQAVYDRIEKYMLAAYNSVPPTDGELERMNNMFCRMVDDQQ